MAKYFRITEIDAETFERMTGDELDCLQVVAPADDGSVYAAVDEELEDFNPIVIDSVRKICVFSDKHNFDRNSMLSYFAGTLKTFSEIATIENYEV